MENKTNNNLKKSKYGSFLIIPVRYDENVNTNWLSSNAEIFPFTTMDMAQSIKESLNNGETSVVDRYIISADKVMSEFFEDEIVKDIYISDGVSFEEDFKFSLLDMELYIFNTRVAFICVKFKHNSMGFLDTICNLWYNEKKMEYYYLNEKSEHKKFDFYKRILKICSHLNVTADIKDDVTLFLEAYVYTTAVVEKRFDKLQDLKKSTFNLHLLQELDADVEDGSEEDVRFVYAKKNQDLNSYRWGCCVTSQTISYIVGNEDLDIDYELADQAESGLPIVMLALYQKYTSIRFKELAYTINKQRIKKLKRLKKELLQFQAYGIISSSNISRWHNVRQIYFHVLQCNGVSEAIQDTATTLNLLIERQKEVESMKGDAIMGLLSIFSAVSIPSSIVGLFDVIMGTNYFNIAITLVSFLAIIMTIIVLLFYKGRE